MKKVRLLMAPLAVSLVMLASSGVAAALPLSTHLFASSAKDEICTGAGLGGQPDITGKSVCGDNGALFASTLTTIINLLSAIIGLLAVIMIIVAGARFITSGGDASKVAGAKNALIYAIIGLIIVVLAQIIVHFVINTITDTQSNQAQASTSTNTSGSTPNDATYHPNRGPF